MEIKTKPKDSLSLRLTLDAYKVKAILSLGALSFHKRDFDSAFELGEASRLDEAENVSRLTIASHFAPYYPEWQSTFSEIRSTRKSRSTVSISRPQEQVEPLEPVSDVLQFPTIQETADLETIFEMSEIAGIALTPLQLLGVVLKIALKNIITHEEIDLICSTFTTQSMSFGQTRVTYNLETTFSMIKAKFGGFVRYKLPVAQTDNVLCNILAHNIFCLIQSMCVSLRFSQSFYSLPKTLKVMPDVVNKAERLSDLATKVVSTTDKHR